MLLVVRLMWSLTAQRRLSVITRTITQARSGGGGARVGQVGMDVVGWGAEQQAEELSA